MYFFKCTFENLFFLWSYFLAMKFSFGYQAEEENWYLHYVRQKATIWQYLERKYSKSSPLQLGGKLMQNLNWCKKNTFPA